MNKIVWIVTTNPDYEQYNIEGVFHDMRVQT